MTFDEFLALLSDHIRKDKVWMVDPQRQMEFAQAYKGISEIVLREDPTAKIECLMHEADIGAGVIRIETDWFTVREISKFCESIQKANNLEIYPTVHETLRISIMFHGVCKRIA